MKEIERLGRFLVVIIIEPTVDGGLRSLGLEFQLGEDMDKVKSCRGAKGGEEIAIVRVLDRWKKGHQLTKERGVYREMRVSI